MNIQELSVKQIKEKIKEREKIARLHNSFNKHDWISIHDTIICKSCFSLKEKSINVKKLCEIFSELARQKEYQENIIIYLLSAFYYTKCEIIEKIIRLYCSPKEKYSNEFNEILRILNLLYNKLKEEK